MCLRDMRTATENGMFSSDKNPLDKTGKKPYGRGWHPPRLVCLKSFDYHGQVPFLHNML